MDYINSFSVPPSLAGGFRRISSLFGSIFEILWIYLLGYSTLLT